VQSPGDAVEVDHGGHHQVPLDLTDEPGADAAALRQLGDAHAFGFPQLLQTAPDGEFHCASTSLVLMVSISFIVTQNSGEVNVLPDFSPAAREAVDKGLGMW